MFEDKYTQREKTKVLYFIRKEFALKKSIRLRTAILIFVLLGNLFSLTAYAEEWLETCRLCGGKGDYHCVACGNTGTVTCDGCGGAGGSKCQGDTYKGNPCNNGYYTCSSCNGDGKNRTGDGKIVEGVCGNCGGAGKLRCVVCSNDTPGWNTCGGCGGSGKHECPEGTCKVSRQYGWHCPECKGTGFMLVGNPMPPKENNDGVRNVPKKGDWVFTDDNGSYYVYGGKKGGSAEKTNSESAVQPPTTDNSATEKTDFPPADLSLLPENRNTDFDIPIPASYGKTAQASVSVQAGKMTDKEQEYFAELPEEELAQILTNVRTIVSSAEVGKAEKKTEEVLQTLAEYNGIAALADEKILPLYFEGHQEIGFPVRVTVKLEKGQLADAGDLFIYHITESGDIELLGQAECEMFDDGSIESISFYTSSFSSFFTSAKKLKTDIKANTVENETGDNKLVIFISVAVIIVAAITVLALIIAKKRRNR